MKRLLPLLLAALAASFAARADDAAAASAAAHSLTQAERDAAVKALEASRATFLAAIEGVTEAQWTFKPAPDRWSIAEAAEHIAVTEEGLRGMIVGKILAGPPATKEELAAAKGKDEAAPAAARNRSEKKKAPEPFKPTGRFANEAATRAAFEKIRAETIEWIKSSPADFRGHVMKGPVGPMDAYDWTLFLSGHSERHTAQIEEVKADPKFPKG